MTVSDELNMNYEEPRTHIDFSLSNFIWLYLKIDVFVRHLSLQLKYNIVEFGWW